MDALSHIDQAGNPQMVDISEKITTKRIAVARAIVVLGKEIFDLIEGEEIMTKKGPVFQTALIAGVMASKKTSELIPFCHPVGLDNCKLVFKWGDNYEVIIECEAIVTAKTGVEMEALTGVSVAALTVYDMCKAVSHHILIKEIRLVSKTGGKSDFSL